MVVNFEVGKTYVYNGEIGDPSPFISLLIPKEDALVIVSGEPLVCTCVCNKIDSSPLVGFNGMRHDGWVFIGLYRLFDEVVGECPPMNKNVGKICAIDWDMETPYGLSVNFEVPAPSSEVDWEKKYEVLERRYNKLKEIFVDYIEEEY